MQTTRTTSAFPVGKAASERSSSRLWAVSCLFQDSGRWALWPPALFSCFPARGDRAFSRTLRS